MIKNPTLTKIAIILLFLSILFGLRLTWFSLFQTAEPAHVVNGVLDLRGRDLVKAKLVKLDGEWSFYPSQWISYSDLAASTQSPLSLQVPGDWSRALKPDPASSYGFGTYRLRILVDPLKQPVSLWIKQVQSASAVEINGTPLPENGRVSKNREEYKPNTTSYTAPFYSEGTTEIEVLLRAANFDHPYKGGIGGPVYFGSKEAVDRTHFYTVGFQLLTTIILLLHGLYACILYFFNPKERALFLFGLMTLSVTIILLFRNDGFVLAALPISYTGSLKFRLIAFLWQNLLILLVFRKFTSGAGINKGLRLYITVLSLYTGFLLIAPASWINTSNHMGLVQLVALIPYFGLIYSMGRLILTKREEKDVVFLLLSGAAILSNQMWNVWDLNQQVVLVYYPLDVLAAIVGFSAFWFKKYIRNAQEKTELADQLKKADKLKDQFLANTSHELRTPLHGILNLAQNVMNKEEDKLTESSRKEMELLVNVARRMSHMLGDLLDVVRLQEHRITLQQEPLSIQSVVPGVIGMLSYMTEGKPIQLTMSISESMPLVLADEKRLVQVLLNLVHNALKYTEEGSITVSTEEQNGRAFIQVTDTGVGMTQETMARVFLPYEQGPHGIRDGRGVGLGLSICRQLIELHGGSLTIQSDLGKGSVFRFDLPLADAVGRLSSLQKPSLRSIPVTDESLPHMTEWGYSEQDTRKSLLPGSIPPLLTGAKVNILVVDDDPVNLNVLSGILTSEPYALTAVNSAHEALDWLNTRQFDLLIADVMMPAMSGYELTQKAREKYSISELPILLLTARSQPADIYTGFISGANDYVTKPVDAMELKYRIRALIAMNQSYNERLRMEAAYLQAQIQPHFLFNTLNSILALSDIDTKKMQELVSAFISFLQISFDFQNTNQLVPLSHELKLVEAYLQIEQTRFAERLSVVWKVEPDIRVQIPPLSIQPLVENAVKHGLLDRPEGGTVQIRIARLNHEVRIEVQDNGQGMDQGTLANLLESKLKGKGGIGLANTHRRLMQLYGQGLTISSQVGEGTTVSFTVPYSNRG
ncbi:hybrid sensor histidine kinase/response regulator [Gorillibacterium timonense]|uniref:hybrid sensor histidine kinase/response regulator n=1 Tax=Gorillibacterium timonense TaxID=1689269 RepID=UPI00071C536D|nr:ATP-binding protein [Gorillibacterium timonense]